MTYGLLIYDYASTHGHLFDSVDLSAQFYPNDILGIAQGANGQQTPIWGSGNVIAYLIVKSHIWTQEMTDAINDSADDWNLNNPLNQTGALQLIFTSEESDLIASQLLARQTEIINTLS
jgi:hypothetical protein